MAKYYSPARCLLLLFVLLFVAPSLKSQNITRLTSLDNSVLETSGLIFLNNKLITHNDSGDIPALYEIDTMNGSVSRKVVLSNVEHADWEDICNDDTFIYIGDFGNNWGNRQNLRIYRISISEYFESANDTVEAEVINFSYVEQTKFKDNPNFTNYDTEALISYNDSLYIFTKNWGDNLSYIYSCPKLPGTYQLKRVDIIDAKGLITGASYKAENGTIIMCGYIFTYPFLIEIKDFTSNKFSDGKIARYLLPRQGSTQIEGITVAKPHGYFLSSEMTKKGESSLYRFSDSDLQKMKPREAQLGSTFLIRILSITKNSDLFFLLWKIALFFYL